MEPINKKEAKKTSFIKKSKPPPEVKEGEILTANIDGIVYPIESKYVDEKGRNKQQIRFELNLAGGYQTNAWIQHYTQPNEKSTLGTLCLTFMKVTGKQFTSVDQVLEAIKNAGQILVKCSGFKEKNSQLYPKFKIIPDKFPSQQKTLEKQPQKLQQTTSNIELNSLSPELQQKIQEELGQ